MLPVNATPIMQFDEDQGKLVLITAATVEKAGLVIGRDYHFVARGAMALCRWGSGDAGIADNEFDFAVGENSGPVIVRAVQTIINVIEADSSSAATAVLAIGRIAEV